MKTINKPIVRSEWNIPNAVNRDVERQHLNKILKDIRDAIDAVNTSTTFSPTRVELRGAVSGSGIETSDGRIVVSTSISQKGVKYVEEAPANGSAYWRRDKAWHPVDLSILYLTSLDDEGIIVKYLEGGEGGTPKWAARVIEGVDGEIVVENGNGAAGNPLIGLAEVGNTGVGTQIVDVDEFGRAVGTSPAAYYHDQPSLASTWTINHNLGRKVQTNVYTVGGVLMLANIINVSDNQAQVLFDEPVNGYAVIH